MLDLDAGSWIQDAGYKRHRFLGCVVKGWLGGNPKFEIRNSKSRGWSGGNSSFLIPNS